VRPRILLAFDESEPSKRAAQFINRSFQDVDAGVLGFNPDRRIA
jgi:hypothetical protein